MGDKASSSSSSSLAPGFRFHPTDEELVIYYLKRKVCGKPFRVDAISVIDIYKLEPWDLPDRSRLKSRDLEWYFFSALDKKYGNGWRTNRATEQGYWKTTGKDRSVRRGEKTVGMKKTLVFHIGRAPHGERTNWVMHEYRLVDEELSQTGIAQDAFVLCRVFRKSGPGPKNGEQYGAPFLEEEWDDNLVVPKNEFANEVYCGLGDDDRVQQQEEYIQDHAQAIIPQNDVLVGTDGGDGFNYLENSVGSSEEDHKFLIGTGQNAGLQEVPDQNMYFLPEQFQIDQTPNENDYFDMSDFLNPADDNNLSEGPVDGEPTYSDAPQGLSVVNGSVVNDLNASEADENPFNMLDECNNYFDAADTESNLLALNPSEFFEFEDPYLDQSVFAEEEKQVFPALPGSPELPGDEGASSSEQKPEIGKVSEDVQHYGWSFAQHFRNILGDIAAPTAYAAELPMKEASCGQTSAARSTSSVHVTASIHISETPVIGSEKTWSVAKMFIFGKVNLSFGFMGNKLFSKVSEMILHSGFNCYMLFGFLSLLSTSYKLGSIISTR
ncbi:Nac domain [Thalictrum thalictroides]|uniref:Nac domain n=1 Tax=Thalictrum thalictroides TaxID=46969 RepID=A0A7J6WKE2_THATH|nr:Nac domain [Thalictrum thalictroides]